MRVTLHEVETHWSITDLQDAHAMLDMLEDAEAQQHLEAAAEAESKR
jgi:hypothetical protein